MTFDLGPRSKVKNAIFTNITKTMRDRYFICIIDLKEVIYGLSFGAMTFDLGPWSKVKNAIFTNITKIMKDKRLLLYYRHIENHIWAFIWCHDL